MMEVYRDLCLRCLRPQDVCYCSRLVAEDTHARVVILQHPREQRVAIGTGRMAHLSLTNSELHSGVTFDDHPRVRELAAQDGTFLLFPGAHSTPPDEVDAGAIRHLVVIDGTWPQARKVLKVNPLLQKLPCVGLVPRRPGNYRIRREPSAECLATIEAVAEVMGVLERDAPRFDAILGAFEWMVDQQIDRAATRTTPPYRKRPRVHPAIPEHRLLAKLDHAVLVHVEVNSHGRRSNVPGIPEVLHLVAKRALSGETFEAVLAPRRPLAANAARHCGIEEDRILSGESLASAQERWREFLRDEDVLCSWRPGHVAQLRRDGFAVGKSFDLRSIIARRFQSRPGTLENAARALGASGLAEFPARADRMVEWLRQVVEVLPQIPWPARARPPLG